MDNNAVYQMLLCARYYVLHENVQGELILRPGKGFTEEETLVCVLTDEQKFLGYKVRRRKKGTKVQGAGRVGTRT